MTRTHPKIGTPPSSIGLGNDKKEWVGKSSEGKATNGPSGDAGAMRGRVLKTEVQGEGVLLASPYTKAILCHIIKGKRWREKGKESHTGLDRLFGEGGWQCPRGRRQQMSRSRQRQQDQYSF
jgi:hypothetical protein